MLWIFSRGREQIRVENGYDKHTDEFLLIVVRRGERCDTRRFETAHAFRAWLAWFAQELEADGWTAQGPAIHTVEPVNGPHDPTGEISATVARPYTYVTRTFDLLLSRRVVRGARLWMVERVMEHGGRRFPHVPGIEAVAASTPDEAFARACDCIDKWLWRTSR
jgi:hypothetical protein